LGRVLRSGFAFLPIKPADLTDAEFHDYVTMICQALRRLADAHIRSPTPPEDSDG
jgi:hypothetical protein